jgi:hypothetical protein
VNRKVFILAWLSCEVSQRPCRCDRAKAQYRAYAVQSSSLLLPSIDTAFSSIATKAIAFLDEVRMESLKNEFSVGFDLRFNVILSCVGVAIKDNAQSQNLIPRFNWMPVPWTWSDGSNFPIFMRQLETKRRCWKHARHVRAHGTA